MNSLILKSYIWWLLSGLCFHYANEGWRPSRQF